MARIEQERIEKEAAEKERIERLQNDKSDKSKDKKKRKDLSKDFPTDLLVVPQRQAAKKASENMMRTQITGSLKKELTRDEEKKELPKEISKTKETRDSSKDTSASSIKDSPVKQKTKMSKSTNKTNTELTTLSSSLVVESLKEKDTKPKKAEKLDKDIMVAYVPQRQAAKKAAEHIKGLGKVVVSDATTPTVISEEKPEKIAPPTSSTKSLQPLPSAALSKSNSKYPFPYFCMNFSEIRKA